MFDLEKRIAAWRASMAASLGDKRDILDELESHVREQWHRLALEGLPAEQAWDRAVERLGRPTKLAAEFGKNDSAQPLGWAAGWLVFSVYTLLGLGSMILVWRRGDQLLGIHVLSVTMGYGAVLAFGALAIWSFVSRAVGGWDATMAARLRWWGQRFCWAGLLLSALGVVLGALWAKENWGRYWDWDVKEIGGLSVVAWAAASLWLLCRRPSLGALGWVIGLIGNMVVWSAWFGAKLISSGLHQYPEPTMVAFVLFMGVHALMLALALILAKRPSAAESK
jgi:hypothetical protein